MIDVSHEMNTGGYNFKKTIETVKIALKSIPVGSIFNICAFGSEFSFCVCFGYKSKPYNPENIAEALKELHGYMIQSQSNQKSDLFSVIDQMINWNTEKEMRTTFYILMAGKVEQELEI